MNPIKLRAWDKVNKCFVFVYVYQDARFIEAVVKPNAELAPWELWIGITDIEGNDVYQGDVVRCTKGCSHEVVFDQEIGGTFGGGMPGWSLKGLYKNGGHGYAWIGKEKVVGNIHEGWDEICRA